jgi:hypothetical protein
MKDLLESILPKRVFVGTDPYCQPAYLDLEKLEYNMTNKIPRKKEKGLSFFTYQDFEKWTEDLNSVINEIEKHFSILLELFEISNYINQEFNHPYLPKISLSFEIQLRNSVILSCKFLLENIKERNKIKGKFNSFLKNNQLGSELNEIKENVKKYRNEYPNYVKILKKHHNSKLDILEDSYSVLKLSQRSQVPFIASRDFLLEEERKIKNENSLETMRRKRLVFFEN